MMKPEQLIEFMSQTGKSPPVFLLGKIPSNYTTGRPTVQFDGETSPSTRQYPYLAPYVPAANDRVLMALVNNSAVILGKIV